MVNTMNVEGDSGLQRRLDDLMWEVRGDWHIPENLTHLEVFTAASGGILALCAILGLLTSGQPSGVLVEHSGPPRYDLPGEGSAYSIFKPGVRPIGACSSNLIWKELSANALEKWNIDPNDAAAGKVVLAVNDGAKPKGANQICDKGEWKPYHPPKMSKTDRRSTYMSGRIFPRNHLEVIYKLNPMSLRGA